MKKTISCNSSSHSLGFPVIYYHSLFVLSFFLGSYKTKITLHRQVNTVFFSLLIMHFLKILNILKTIISLIHSSNIY